MSLSLKVGSCAGSHTFLPIMVLEVSFFFYSDRPIVLSTLIQSWGEKKLSSSTKIKEWVELSPTSHPFPSQETTPPTEILVLKLSFFSSLNSVYFTDRFELYLVTPALSSKRFSKFLFKKAESDS